MSQHNETRDHVCVPVVTDEAPGHPAMSLTLCAICVQPLAFQSHEVRQSRPQRVLIDEMEPEAVLV